MLDPGKACFFSKKLKVQFFSNPFSCDSRSFHHFSTTAGKCVWQVIGNDRWTYFEIKLSLWYYWKEVTKSKIKQRMILGCFHSFFKEAQTGGGDTRLYLISEFPHFGPCVLNSQTTVRMSCVPLNFKTSIYWMNVETSVVYVKPS